MKVASGESDLGSALPPGLVVNDRLFCITATPFTNKVTPATFAAVLGFDGLKAATRISTS
ncbi:hypothetical protein F4212_13135 [Candidatus Poribacteria bacterium]|nr:hypothetical protein [Candidatus Poribacteria bacterium]